MAVVNKLVDTHEAVVNQFSQPIKPHATLVVNRRVDTQESSSLVSAKLRCQLQRLPELRPS
jgi:hypothetical protein